MNVTLSETVTAAPKDNTNIKKSDFTTSNKMSNNLLVQEKRGFATQQLSSLKHTPAGQSRLSIMSSVASSLGLYGGASCHVPYYLMFNFLYAHAALSSRTLKQYLKLDHNVSPREDVSKYGDKAVQSGKITQEQLNMIKRNEAAHANRMDNFSMFAASTVLAVAAGVPNEVLNAGCLIYTLSSLAYGAAYICITDWRWTYLRSTFFWIGNDVCLYLLYRAGKALNSK